VSSLVRDPGAIPTKDSVRAAIFVTVLALSCFALVAISDADDQPTPEQEHLEYRQKTVSEDPSERFNELPGLAKAAFDAGEFDLADRYANETLSAAPSHKGEWNYGDAIFYGNFVLGRVALKRDRNISAANNYLLASSETPGSPSLKSFGPNMSLAKELLEAGERDVVLEFLARCRKFWLSGTQKLDAWIAEIKEGGNPEFKGQLMY